MAPDDEDSEDLYDDEFDFVDDDDESDLDDGVEDSEVAEDPGDTDSSLVDEPTPREAVAERDSYDDAADDVADDGEPDRSEEKVDEFGRPAPVANYIVHIYEHKNFKRTIDRPFTPEDAEAFASEFNRTSKSYGRFAVAGKVDAKPRKALD